MKPRLALLACSLPLVLAAPAAAIAIGPTGTRTTSSAALLDVETKRLDAEVAGNVKLLATLIADDAIYVHANGEMQDKAARLQSIVSGASHYRNIATSARSVRFYGDTAITHGQIVLDVGVDRHIAGIYTGVYARRAGRWMLLSWQTTPITPRR
jgi:hypothetical protein